MWTMSCSVVMDTWPLLQILLWAFEVVCCVLRQTTAVNQIVNGYRHLLGTNL